MLILLSPAKKLLNPLKPYPGITSLPVFQQKTNTLAQLMKSKSPKEIAALMDLSDSLAELNYDRYQTFSLESKSIKLSYPALFLFQGDVYQGLKAASWDQKAIAYSQQHLGILSGLYGLLKPLDLIQPYRLEMGVRLSNPMGKNLYDFWRETVTLALNQQLEVQKNQLIINLASTEYFKVVDETKLNYPVIDINFYEKKKGELKIIGIYAKKARGSMAKFLIQNQIDDLTQLKQFEDLGYKFHPSTSSDSIINFVR